MILQKQQLFCMRVTVLLLLLAASKASAIQRAMVVAELLHWRAPMLLVMVNVVMSFMSVLDQRQEWGLLLE